MTTVPHDVVRVTVGVDTHEDVHVAVALDQLGRWLGEISIPTHTGAFARLVDWVSEFGVTDRFGVEGTGSWGAGLARWLRAEGLVVVEVERPRRKHRRHGKSDVIDAEAAARAVLSGEATAVPKTGDGPVEMIRVLRLTRRSAVKNRTMTANQINALVITAPDALRDQLRAMSTRRRVAVAVKFRTGDQPATVVEATRYALRELAPLPTPDRTDHPARRATGPPRRRHGPGAGRQDGRGHTHRGGAARDRRRQPRAPRA